MFEKKLSCDVRVIFGLISLLFFLALFVSDFFALVGLIYTGYITITGVCLGTEKISPMVCENSTFENLADLRDDLKTAAADGIERVKEIFSSNKK